MWRNRSERISAKHYTSYLKQNYSTSSPRPASTPLCLPYEEQWWFLFQLLHLKIMYIILSRDVKSSLRLQYNISGNASEVAISSYTMAGWQHRSKHAKVWRQCPLFPWEQIQNKWPPFRVDVILFVMEITKNALSPRITVLVKLGLYLQRCLTERKTGLQQRHVKICKYGICMEYGRFFPFHTSNLPFHT